jgi:hypothetical protein
MLMKAWSMQVRVGDSLPLLQVNDRSRRGSSMRLDFWIESLKISAREKLKWDVFLIPGQVEITDGKPGNFECGCQGVELIKEGLGQSVVTGAIDVGDSEDMFRGGGAEGKGA